MAESNPRVGLDKESIKFSQSDTDMDMFNTRSGNGIVIPPQEDYADDTGSKTNTDRIQELETLLEESKWARVEAEHRVASLEGELLLARRQESEYRETITQLQNELNESSKNNMAVTPVLPPPPEFRTKSKSCTQLLAADYVPATFPLTSLSVGDIESETEQDDDVFADSIGHKDAHMPSAIRDSGVGALLCEDSPMSKLHEAEQQRDKLLKVLAKEVCKCRDDLVLANKTITEVNKKIVHFNEISSQCPLRGTSDKSLPSHIRGFCVEIQKLLDDGVWDFSLSLVADHMTLTRLREELDFYEDFSGLFWSVVSEWNRRCRDGRRATMLGQLIQACADCHISNSLHADPIPPEDLCLIEDHYPLLVKHLLVSPTLIYLRDSGLISSSVVHYILEATNTGLQVLRFLDILSIFGPRSLDILIRALRRSDQGHIANMITRSHPERFQDTPDSPPVQPRRVPVQTTAVKSPRVENSIKMFPQQTLESKTRKSFFRRPKWLFRSGKYQFNKN